LDYEIDGINQWSELTAESIKVPRNEIIHSIDPYQVSSSTDAVSNGVYIDAAIRKGDYKLILSESDSVGWYNATNGSYTCPAYVSYGTIHFFNIRDDPFEKTNLYYDDDFDSKYSFYFYDLWNLFSEHLFELQDYVYAEEEESVAEAVWDLHDYCIVPWD